jgi:hypothetical protein
VAAQIGLALAPSPAAFLAYFHPFLAATELAIASSLTATATGKEEDALCIFIETSIFAVSSKKWSFPILHPMLIHSFLPLHP